MVITDGRFKLVSGTAHPGLARDIAAALDMPLSSAHIGRFPDGEIDIKINEDIRGGDVFVIQSTCPPVNEAIVELALLVDCLVRASASRITAVVPYYGYARKDRKDEGRVPISAKAIANLLVSCGINRLLTVDLHAQQIQGFFDIPVDHLWARRTLELGSTGLDTSNLVICSPDVGGVKLARAWARSLDVSLAIVDKRRTGPDSVVMENIIGEVEGKDVLLADDMISTAGTITEAARILKENGAQKISIAATHPVFSGQAVERLNQAPVDAIYVCDTIPLRGELPDRLQVVSVAPMLARAISRIHREESVSSLFED